MCTLTNQIAKLIVWTEWFLSEMMEEARTRLLRMSRDSKRPYLSKLKPSINSNVMAKGTTSKKYFCKILSERIYLLKMSLITRSTFSRRANWNRKFKKLTSEICSIKTQKSMKILQSSFRVPISQRVWIAFLSNGKMDLTALESMTTLTRILLTGGVTKGCW